MLHTLREPPEKGSLRESILLLYLVKERHIAFLRDLALAQVIANKKYDVFEDLQKEMFPWVEDAKKDEKTDHVKRLMAEVQKGPLSVAVGPVPSVKSRLNRQVKRVQASDQSRKEQDEFYKRMGSLF